MEQESGRREQEPGIGGAGAAERQAGASDLYQVGDAVELKKLHACGGRGWTITRTGREVGLRCRTCDRILLLPREQFLRRVRAAARQPDVPS